MTKAEFSSQNVFSVCTRKNCAMSWKVDAVTEENIAGIACKKLVSLYLQPGYVKSLP